MQASTKENKDSMKFRVVQSATPSVTKPESINYRDLIMEHLSSPQATIEAKLQSALTADERQKFDSTVRSFAENSEPRNSHIAVSCLIYLMDSQHRQVAKCKDQGDPLLTMLSRSLPFQQVSNNSHRVETRRLEQTHRIMISTQTWLFRAMRTMKISTWVTRSSRSLAPRLSKHQLGIAFPWILWSGLLMSSSRQLVHLG